MPRIIHTEDLEMPEDVWRPSKPASNTIKLWGAVPREVFQIESGGWEGRSRSGPRQSGPASKRPSSQASNTKALGGGPTGGVPNRIWWLGGSFKGWFLRVESGGWEGAASDRPPQQATKRPSNTIKLWGGGPQGGFANRIRWLGGCGQRPAHAAINQATKQATL